MNDYDKMKSKLEHFLAEYKKEATETAPGEAVVGDGTEQGTAGTAMTQEIKSNVPAGTAVGGGNTTAGTSDGGPQIVNPPEFTESKAPGDDMAILDENIKKASAAQIRFEAGLMNMIDRIFQEEARKTASEEQPQQKVSIEQSAAAWRKYHVAQVKSAFGCTTKQANDIVDQLAAEDPGAVLPPEALSSEDADAILAAAAEDDAAMAAEGATGGGVEGTTEGGAEGTPEGDESDDAAVEQLAQAFEQLQGEGFSQEEIVGAIMEETGLQPEDLMGAVVDDLKSQGLSDEDIEALAQEVEGLQAEGVTPEQLAEALAAEEQ